MSHDSFIDGDSFDEPSAAPSYIPQQHRRRGAHLIDDLDASELDDQGRDLTEGASLATILEDPELLEEDGPTEHESLEDAEIEEAEALDLSTFPTGRDRGYEIDAFEDWVRLSRKYGILTHEQIDRYVEMLQDDDEEFRAMAEDRLVAHNIKWIVKCLYEVASRRIMETPGDLRNDALSAAREGFLLGIRKYDPVKAEQVGTKGHKKTLLPFTKYWIRKVYLEWYYRAVLNLNPDAAEARKKVMDTAERLVRMRERGEYKSRYSDPIHDITLALEEQATERLALKTLRAELGRKPTTSEVQARRNEYSAELEQNRSRARKQLVRKELAEELGREPTPEEVRAGIQRLIEEKRWVDYSVPLPLRRAGALTADRVRSLLEYSTVQESLDAPVQDDDNSGPKLRDYIASSDVTPEERIQREQLASALNARLDLVPGAKTRELYRLRYGFGPRSSEPYPTSNLEELMYWLGRGTRASVVAFENQAARSLRGEVLVDPDALSRPGFGFSPNSVRRLHEAYAKAVADLEVAQHDRDQAQGTDRRMPSMGKVAEARAKVAELEGEIEHMRDRVRSVVDLRRIVQAEGVWLSTAGQGSCALEEDCDGTLTVSASNFSCSGCGREGDLFDWMDARGIKDPAERDVAAARAAIGLPENVERDGKYIVAVRDPQRREGLRAVAR